MRKLILCSSSVILSHFCMVHTQQGREDALCLEPPKDLNKTHMMELFIH